MEYSWTGLNVKLLAGCILLFWIGVILVPCKESWRRVFTLHTVPAVRQVVFADVQITIRQRVAFSRCSDIGQHFAPIGLHKTDAASDWLLIKRHYLGKKGLPGVQVQKKSDYISYRRHFSIYRKEDVLFQPKIRGASEKFKNLPRPLLRPRSVNFRQHFRNLSRKTVPLMGGKCKLLQRGSAYPHTQRYGDIVSWR